MVIDNIVYDCLRKAGWNEHRRLDPAPIRAKLLVEGYPALDVVVRFLQEFEGLVVRFANLKNGRSTDDINFSFEHATHIETPGKIKKLYYPRIKKELCLIGTAYRDY